MKSSRSLLFSLLLATLLAREAAAQNVCAPTACVPQTNGMYSSQGVATFDANPQLLQVSNLILETFSSCGNLPASNPGASVTLSDDFMSEFEGVSTTRPLPHPLTHYTAPGNTSLTITFLDQDGSTRIFDTEMTQLDITGGDLPPGWQIRENPALHSTGRLIVQPETGGGYRFNSYFDVYLQISYDAGIEWNSADGPMRITLTSPACSTPTLADSWGRVRASYR